MTQLLASVTDPHEAMIALRAGADLIDLKNPAIGTLGALPLVVIRETVRRLDNFPSSATIGDLPADPALIAEAIHSTAATGVHLVKVGFFGSGGDRECIEALGPVLEHGPPTVAVLFADRDPDLSLLSPIAGSGFVGVMLDTADKSHGRLSTVASLGDITAFAGAARALGLFVGLAGSLRGSDIAALSVAQPDYLGFRTALCRGGRGSPIDAAAVRGIRAEIDRLDRQAAHSDMGNIAPPSG